MPPSVSLLTGSDCANIIHLNQPVLSQQTFFNSVFGFLFFFSIAAGTKGQDLHYWLPGCCLGLVQKPSYRCGCSCCSFCLPRGKSFQTRTATAVLVQNRVGKLIFCLQNRFICLPQLRWSPENIGARKSCVVKSHCDDHTLTPLPPPWGLKNQACYHCDDHTVTSPPQGKQHSEGQNPAVMITPPTSTSHCYPNSQSGYHQGKYSVLERLRFTFTPNGKREFVPRDQVFPLIVVHCFLLLHKNKWFHASFFHENLFWTVFICLFSILRNSQLESHVCRLT